MKGILVSTEEECYYSILAFSFFQYFYIHWFVKQIIVIHSTVGVVKGTVYIFLRTQPPCYSFRMREVLAVSGMT